MGICSRKGGGRARWENKIKTPLFPKNPPPTTKRNWLFLQRCRHFTRSWKRLFQAALAIWEGAGIELFCTWMFTWHTGMGSLCGCFNRSRRLGCASQIPTLRSTGAGFWGIILMWGGRATTLLLWEPLVSCCGPPAFPEILPASGNLQIKSSIYRETKASEDSSQDVLLNGRCCRHLFQLREKWGEVYPKYFNKRQLAEQPSLCWGSILCTREKTRNLYTIIESLR